MTHHAFPFQKGLYPASRTFFTMAAAIVLFSFARIAEGIFSYSDIFNTNSFPFDTNIIQLFM